MTVNYVRLSISKLSQLYTAKLVMSTEVLTTSNQALTTMIEIKKDIAQ